MTTSSAPAPEEAAQALEIPSSHAVIRTAKTLGLIFLAVAAFEAALFVPAVARQLRGGPEDGAIAAALAFAGAVVATVAYRMSGPSRVYLWAEYTESALAACGYSYLILASGAPHSAFWFVYLFHCFALASTGTSLRNGVLLALAPAAVALGFVSKGQISAAVASTVAGAFGMMLYLSIAKAFDELEATRQRETRLKADLAELSVARERTRIARDLHDSIGVQLSALAARVRGFASGSTMPLGQAELAALERRVLDVVEELRDVVLVLRREPVSVAEAIDLLSKRCREICQNVEFGLKLEGSLAAPILQTAYTDLARIVFELGRQAARGAGAKKVELHVRAADDLQLYVIADSAPDRFSESASPMRRRVEDLGGTLHVASLLPGTRVEVRLPGALR
jgi:signal transduction histidine kinase